MASETQPLIGTQSTSSPLTRSRFRTQLACGAVLVTEIFERIAMYGAIGNLVMFLNKTPYNWTSYNSVNALFMFTAVTYMTAIIGGWIADSYLGKCRTILLFFLIYIGGYVFLPLLYPYPDPKFEPSQPPGWCAGSGNSSGLDTDHMDAWDEKCSWAVYLSLGIIALGSAGVKANFAPFGADQVSLGIIASCVKRKQSALLFIYAFFISKLIEIYISKLVEKEAVCSAFYL